MKNNIWQSMETAPKDGTVILTNLGYAKFKKLVKSAPQPMLFYCNIYGELLIDQDRCAIESYSAYWMPIPELPR